MMQIAIVLQARMKSDRLPGKVLLEVLGKPLLEYEIERLKRSKLAHQLIVATSTDLEDDPIATLAEELGVAFFRGSESDVLTRYYESIRDKNVDIVVRCTGDCPLIDPKVVDQCIFTYLEQDVDFVSNTLKRTYPRGMDTEVFSKEALKKAYQLASDPWDREHVTPYFYRGEMPFSNYQVKRETDASQYRLSIDTEDDYLVIKKVLERLVPEKPQFTLEDILEVLVENPDWSLSNQHVEQKKSHD